MVDEIAAVVGAYILLLAMWVVFLFVWSVAVWWNLSRIRKGIEGIRRHLDMARWAAGEGTKEMAEALRQGKKDG